MLSVGYQVCVLQIWLHISTLLLQFDSEMTASVVIRSDSFREKLCVMLKFFLQ